MKTLLFYVSICLLMAALNLNASSNSVVTIQFPRRHISLNFNDYDGTYSNIPPGIAVSVDGASLLGSSDTSVFHGIDDGGVTTGGCYAWDLSGGDYVFGFQPTTHYFTPGYICMTVSNATGVVIREMQISYDILCMNNENRSSRIDFALSSGTLTPVIFTNLVFISGEAKEESPLWSVYHRSIRVKLGNALRAGKCFKCYWYVDDEGGGWSRDELGIDNVNIMLSQMRGTSMVIR